MLSHAPRAIKMLHLLTILPSFAVLLFHYYYSIQRLRLLVQQMSL